MTKLAVNDPGRAAFETALGQPLDYVRCFNEADAKTHAGTGRAVIVTTKTPFNSPDSELVRLANVYKAFAKPGYFGVWHEPENDIDSGSFTKAQYTAFQKRINDVMGPILRPSGWKMIQIYMGFHFPGGSGGTWGIESTVLSTTEALGADTYMWRGKCSPWACADQTPPKNNIAKGYGPALDYGKSVNKEVLLCEFGIACREAQQTGEEVAQLMQWFADWHKARPADSRYEVITYFYQGPPGFPMEWRKLNSQAIATFKSLGTATPPPPPPPPTETDAQKITRLTAELAAEKAAHAATKTSLAAAEAQLADATADLNTVIVERDALKGRLNQIHTISAV
jgi:hypothetical protein